MEFYRIELGEQRRMMRVMDHHTREGLSTGPVDSTPPFPFSITAGIEKEPRIGKFNHSPDAK